MVGLSDLPPCALSALSTLAVLITKNDSQERQVLGRSSDNNLYGFQRPIVGSDLPRK